MPRRSLHHLLRVRVQGRKRGQEVRGHEAIAIVVRRIAGSSLGHREIGQLRRGLGQLLPNMRQAGRGRSQRYSVVLHLRHKPRLGLRVRGHPGAKSLQTLLGGP